MTDSDQVRDAQGKIIAIINRRALNAWLHFGTTDPSFALLAAKLRHARYTTRKDPRPVAQAVTPNSKK